jgi:maltose alpha-D-glucosyltransferase / alpha-amylase
VLAASDEFNHFAQSLGGGAALADHLGKLIGGLHVSLADNSGDVRFAPEPINGEYLDNVTASVLAHLASMTKSLPRQSKDIHQSYKDAAQRLLDTNSAILAGLSFLESYLKRAFAQRKINAIRVHNDLHLGQVLKRGEELFVFDFEGDPLLPLEERTRKSAPAKDLAGMISSFSSKLYTTLVKENESYEDQTRIEQLNKSAQMWSRVMSACFVRSYLGQTAGCAALVILPGDFFSLLNLHILNMKLAALDHALTYKTNDVGVSVLSMLEFVSAELR